jgi:serine/threonine protein phosphatase PrpC
VYPKDDRSQETQMTTPKTLSVCSMSETGIRPVNEDAYLVTRMTPFPGEFTLISVADGLGGHPAGEVASQLAVRVLEKIVVEQISLLPNSGTPNLCNLMSSAFFETNKTISGLAESHPEWNGMATTLVAALISGSDVCVIGNIGDSRAYRISDTVEQITRDHSRVQDLVEKGFLSEEEAEHHPQKNIVTRIIGRAEDAPDIFTCSLGSCTLLLCTDGLADGLSKNEILAITSGAEFPALCRELVNAAKLRSRDNITLIAAKWPDDTDF